MNRKDFAGLLLSGKAKKEVDFQAPPVYPEMELPANAEPTGSINPYTGNWGEHEVAHLLKRLTYGSPIEEINFFKEMSFPEAIEVLLNTKNESPGLPLKFYVNKKTIPLSDPDWTVPWGQTWINTNTSHFESNKSRLASLKVWWLQMMIHQPRSVEEKMVVFWRNHFAIEFYKIRSARNCYNYLQLIRKHALGNFKLLTKEMTLDHAMLVYLNGRFNKKGAPDENYGRELQELFTLGKGPDSRYNEEDVRQAAKVLTGWETDPLRFTERRHDTSNKVFSSFYNNHVIKGVKGPGGGEAELNELLNMIFAQVEVSKNLCRRLYRFFVYANISESTERDIIDPLAQTFRNSGYDIKPVLRQLFNSEHFFDILVRGAMVKSPLDLIVGSIRDLKIKIPPDSETEVSYRHMDYLVEQIGLMDQELGDVPNVGGWPAYYQDPLFDKIWFTSKTAGVRESFISRMMTGLNRKGVEHTTIIDVLDFARRMPNPGNPGALVEDISKYLLGMPLLPETVNRLKTEFLLSGLESDYYWTNAWNSFMANPYEMVAKNLVQVRLSELMNYFLNMEEYNLM